MKTSKSHKSLQLDRILDKINLGQKLTENEQDFLDKYDSLNDTKFMDYKMLSRFDITNKLNQFMNEFTIICNLCDRDGPIGIKIIDVVQKEEKSYLILEDSMKIRLKDSILYDLIYSHEKWNYSLEAGDEFVELALINKE